MVIGYERAYDKVRTDKTIGARYKYSCYYFTGFGLESVISTGQYFI